MNYSTAVASWRESSWIDESISIVSGDDYRQTDRRPCIRCSWSSVLIECVEVRVSEDCMSHHNTLLTVCVLLISISCWWLNVSMQPRLMSNYYRRVLLSSNTTDMCDCGVCWLLLVSTVCHSVILHITVYDRRLHKASAAVFIFIY